MVGCFSKKTNLTATTLGPPSIFTLGALMFVHVCDVLFSKKKKCMRCSSFKQTQFYMNANLSPQILQMCRPTETSLCFETSNTLSPFINI